MATLKKLEQFVTFGGYGLDGFIYVTVDKSPKRDNPVIGRDFAQVCYHDREFDDAWTRWFEHNYGRVPDREKSHGYTYKQALEAIMKRTLAIGVRHDPF